MKLLITGDWHIRTQRPKNRTDDYFKTQSGKIEWILQYYKNQNCELLLLPGDMFDSPFTPYSTFQHYLQLFKTWSPETVTVFGQHDLRYRVSKDNTPLKAFDSSEALIIPGENFLFSPNICIYGVSFGGEIPKPEDKNKFNILLIHKMIVNETPLWEAQEEYTKASSILKQNDFDLVVSGDNHNFFISEYKNRTLVNCGSLMRSTSAQKEHIPRIVVYETDTREYEIIPIPICPIEEVMDLNSVETEKQTDEKLTAFVKGLSEYKDIGLDFMQNLERRAKTDNIEESIRNLILECAKEGGA